jgi:hypothetical protein
MADQAIDPDVIPAKVIMMFEAAATLEEINEIANTVVEEAKARGFFVDFSAIVALEPDEVEPGSDLHKALTGA